MIYLPDHQSTKASIVSGFRDPLPLPRMDKRLIVSNKALSCMSDFANWPRENLKCVSGFLDCHWDIALLSGQMARARYPKENISLLSYDFGDSLPIRFFLCVIQPISLRNLTILCVCLSETHLTGPIADLISGISTEFNSARVPQTDDIE